MTSPSAPTTLDNLDQLFVSAFQSLHRTLTECERRDRELSKKGVEQIKGRESMVEKCTGGSDEVRKFLESGERIIAEMWRQYTQLTENYTGMLREHQYVPRTLKDVSETVWHEVTKSLEPISRDISQRMEQNHWKGRGADDYMKQLPMQLNAVTEFGQYVEAATIGVDVPGQLQAIVFSAGSAEIGSATMAIQSAMYSQGTSGMYFTACAAASRNLRNVNSWWRTKLMTGEGSWKITLDNHVREMTSSQVLNPIVLKGDKWPRATSATTEIPTPGRNPIVDRQSDPRVRGADRPSGAPGGVNERDYHREDKGGKLW